MYAAGLGAPVPGTRPGRLKIVARLDDCAPVLAPASSGPSAYARLTGEPIEGVAAGVSSATAKRAERAGLSEAVDQVTLSPEALARGQESARTAADGDEASATDAESVAEGEGDTDTETDRVEVAAQEEDGGGFNELSREDEQVVRDMKARDAEVRRHENAHASVGGQYAGSPQYDYQTGPDGKRYAVGGSVSIDVSPVPGEPEKTIEKMRIVRAAALAPAEPSGQDRRVAAEATQTEASARAELAEQKAATADGADTEAGTEGEAETEDVDATEGGDGVETTQAPEPRMASRRAGRYRQQAASANPGGRIAGGGGVGSRGTLLQTTA